MTIVKRLAQATGSFFAGLRTSTQLVSAFGAMLLLATAVGVVGLLGLHQVAGETHDLSKKWLPGVQQLAATKTAILSARDFEVKHSRTSDKSYHAEYEAKMADEAKVVAAALAAYTPLAEGDDGNLSLLSEFSKAWEAYGKAQQRVIGLGREGKQQDAADISDGLSSTAVDEVLLSVEKLWAYNLEGGARSAADAEGIYALAVKAVAGLLVGAIAIGATVAWFFTRALLRRLGGDPAEAAAVARSVASGDLSSSIRLRPGDTDSLLAQLSVMQSSLVKAVRDVREGSEHVAIASTQIAQGNANLSQRTEQQAGALQSTASTMDELGSTVRTNADNALQANQLAQGASDVAQRGGAVVGQVVQTMKGIQDSSRRIGDIIAVIDGIAFQTNILALNAAVEAARAGEQGRGFAVVAAEVRSLAQRSAEAAKEIKNLINASVDRVEQGSALVDQAGTTMNEVVHAIRRVTDIVGEISSASSEQSAGVSQVGQAVADMDRATQQNAALVEESAAAAESLRMQASQLLQSVAVFKIAERTQ
jgi:methyl-accepting chemotaxis protein